MNEVEMVPKPMDSGSSLWTQHRHKKITLYARTRIYEACSKRDQTF